MGQRLVVSVTERDKRIAAIYYQWSAYSVDALRETKAIVHEIENLLSRNEDIRLGLIRFLEQNGGGIGENEKGKERAFVRKLYPAETFLMTGYSRENGLIALSKKGMEDIGMWCEGDVTIDITNKTVVDSVYYYADSLQEYNEEYGENKTVEDCLEAPFNIEQFSFEDIDKVYAFVRQADYEGKIIAGEDGYYILIA